MLTFDSVKTRLDREQSLSYMEFNYMILQAYDFLELNKKENCALQIGGSDQWGNLKMEQFGWIKNFYLLMTTGNFGEIQMIEML